jgi:predicted RNA-binding protein YlqC (UPF0109 family)
LQPQVISVRVLSSNKDIGKLIGENGRDISQIRDSCQAVLHISELIKLVRERILTIKGTADQISAAFDMIAPKLAAAAAASASSSSEAATPDAAASGDKASELTLTLLVPNIMAGRIIGKGGEKIKGIKADSGANVNVANEPVVRVGESMGKCRLLFSDVVHVLRVDVLNRAECACFVVLVRRIRPSAR